MYLIRWREIRILYIRILEPSFSIFLYFELINIQRQIKIKIKISILYFDLNDIQKQIDKNMGFKKLPNAGVFRIY